MSVMRPYIQLINDVSVDGNCGYRAIASLMGYDDDGWKQVRKDMLNELISYRSLYDWLFYEIGRYN